MIDTVANTSSVEIFMKNNNLMNDVQVMETC